MILITISPSRIGQKVWLKFSDDHLMPLNIDDLYRLSLQRGQEITLDLYQQIETRSIHYSLLEYSLRQIAISPKVLQILSQKQLQYWSRLREKYHYQASDISQIVTQINQKLELDGLLDPQAYSEYYIRMHPKYSNQQFKYYFSRLGIPFLKPESDLPKIKALLSKKFARVNFSDYHSRSKAILALSRKGFALDDIKSAIDDLHKNR